MKLKMIVFIVLLLSSYNAYSSLPHEEKSHSTEIVSESENLDMMLDLIKDKEPTTPEIKPPSKCMIWLRSFGISLLYKYHAVKAWIVHKFSKSDKNT